MNRKRVYRLYREEGLMLKPRRPKRHRTATARVVRPAPRPPNERWARDFVHDTLAGARTIRILTVLDVHTRECLALVPQSSFRGADVARILREIGTRRGLPMGISVDNGTEFTSKALDQWAYGNHVTRDFSRPGTGRRKPTDNAPIGAFNGSLRRACLSQYWFTSPADAEHRLRAWQAEYNNARPHRSFEHQPAAHRGLGGYFIPGRNRLRN